MKKSITFLFLCLAPLLAFNSQAKEDKSSEAKSSKVYTEAEFKKELAKQLDTQVERIKKSSVASLTKELLEKERALQERERQLELRAEQVKMGEESLASRILELEGRQKKILGCIDENQRKEAMRVKQLVSVISGMKPAKAAELLSVQDSGISVKIIEMIEPKRASRIFNLMDKEVSARLQKQYLNMRQ